MVLVLVRHAAPRSALLVADLLDHPESIRLQGFRREADRDRFATGRALAKALVGAELGVPARDVVFDTTCAHCGDRRHGKPFAVADPDLSISIAHSGGLVAVAIARVPVGLDVEELRAVADPDSLARRVLSARERETAWGASPSSVDIQKVWVRKEALLKASGHGLAQPMSALTVSAPDHPPALLASQVSALPADGVALIGLDLDPGYVACLAVLSGGRPEVDLREDPGS